MSTYNKLSDEYNRLVVRVNELSNMIAHIDSCGANSAPTRELRLTTVTSGWSGMSTLVPNNADILPAIKQYLEGQLQDARVALDVVGGKLKAVDTLLGDYE